MRILVGVSFRNKIMDKLFNDDEPYEPVTFGSLDDFWFMPSGDKNLPVVEEIKNEDGEIIKPSIFAFVVDADGNSYKNYHHCSRCGGWIEGTAEIKYINTIGPLSGREGEAYICRRCGGEISFFGKYS
jgi:hypothetical protein